MTLIEDWHLKTRHRWASRTRVRGGLLPHAGEDGAQGRNRTTDTRIFSPLLYRLSYLGVGKVLRRGQNEARIKAIRPNSVKLEPGAGCACSQTSFRGRNIPLSLINFAVTKKLLPLLIQIGSISQVHQAQTPFIDQHGLLGHPLLPRLFGYGLVDVLTQGTGHGRHIQAFHLLLVLAAKNGSGHA